MKKRFEGSYMHEILGYTAGIIETSTYLITRIANWLSYQNFAYFQVQHFYI